MEEPPVTGPTSPSGGAHDEGDPGDEGLWAAVEAIGDASSTMAWEPPMVTEKTMTPAASTTEESPR